MRKLKNILLGIMTMTFSLGLVSGCIKDDPLDTTEQDNDDGDGEGQQPESPTTITLNEAKTLINNALAINGPSLLSDDGNNSSNRNVLVKLGKAEFSFVGQGGLAINGLVDRSGDSWSKYALIDETPGNNLKEYFDGESVYNQQGETYNKVEIGESYLGMVVLMLDVMYVDYLFLDDAWSGIYNSSALKTPVSTGYTITLDINMANYVEFASDKCEGAGLPTDGLFGDGQLRQMNKDDGSISLVVNFDSEYNLLGIDLNVKSYTVNGSLDNATLEDNTISIKKYNNEISASSWFNETNYQ